MINVRNVDIYSKLFLFFKKTQGEVVLEDSGTDSHLLTVNVKAEASSETMLNQLQVTHRLLEVTGQKSVLLLQAVSMVVLHKGGRVCLGGGHAPPKPI